MSKSNTPLESIKKSLKEVEYHLQGKKTLKNLKESKSLWKQWEKEGEQNGISCRD